MALGGSITSRGKAGSSPGPCFVENVSFPGDGAYATGGTVAFQSYVRTQLAKPNLEIVDIIPGDCDDNKPEYDKVNDKLKVRVISTGAEVAATTNLSAVTFNLSVVYK